MQKLNTLLKFRVLGAFPMTLAGRRSCHACSKEATLNDSGSRIFFPARMLKAREEEKEGGGGGGTPRERYHKDISVLYGKNWRDC